MAIKNYSVKKGNPTQDNKILNFSELLSDFINKNTVDTAIKEQNDIKDHNPYKWVDIIEFCESPYYLKLNLYPWQKLILKLFYMGSDGNRHLSIGDKDSGCRNCIWNKSFSNLRGFSPCLKCQEYPVEEFDENIEYALDKWWISPDEAEELINTEKEKLFCNEKQLIEADLMDESDTTEGGSVRRQVKSKIGKQFSEMLLVLGRRSGKSMIVSIIALYESYKLLEMGNPQAIFGNLNEGDTITILNVAVSEQQAKESVFDKIKPMITNSAYFKTKISPNSLQNRSVRFITPRDKEINEQLMNEGLPSREGSIYLLSGHSNSDSLVGKNVLVVIIDEMASMVGKDGSKMSDEELYTKLKHSIWTFGRSAKIICISNPLTKDGKFFELYEQSFKDDRILMVQLPSYKVNPTLDQKALNEEKEAAQQAGQYEQYLTQIEARFSGGAADPFIPAEFIDDAFEKGSNRRRAEVGDPHILYYLHLDPANNSDNYALALVHVENDPYNLDQNGKPRKIIIVDHINMWSPSATGDPVIINDVDQYVIDLTRRFNIVSITYDMWESAASTQLLQRMGLPARITHFNSAYKQQIYSTLRNLFYQRNIEFYKLDGFDGTRMKDTYGFVNEASDQFKFLTRRLNRDSFSVFAAAGHYDDIPDCIAGASFIALTGQHGQVSLPRMSTIRMAAFK